MKAILGVAAALSMLMTAGGEALAQATYPDRPVRILAGFAPGGPADLLARIVADKMSEAWGKPVLVENVTGSGGNVATDRVAKAAPDGYTLLLATSGPIVVHPSLYQKLPFDPVKELTPISQICFTPNILGVNNEVPAKTPLELAALARAQPGKLTYASAGVGTTQHLSGELFKFMAGIDIQHVPYRGIAPALPDLLAGRTTMVFGNVSNLVPLVREGKVKGLAVTSVRRSAAVPDLPTMDEAGYPGFDSAAWFALMTTAETPAPVIDRLHRETVRILALPDVRKRFEELGLEPIGNSPAQFAAAIKAEAPRWAKLIKEAGIKPVE